MSNLYGSMILSNLDTSNQVRARLYRDLSENLSSLCPSHYEEPPSLHPLASPTFEQSEGSCRIDGPGAISFEVKLKIFLRSDDTCDLHLAVENGRTSRFTCHLSGGNREKENLCEVGQAMASFLLNEIERRRDEPAPDDQSASRLPPHVPVLLLDEEGNIQDFSDGARRLLGRSRDASIEPCFFSHVHGQNLKRVMRDLAHMVSRRKQQAQWLLRLRTGNERWRWYRATAKNYLDDSEDAVRILLRPLSNR